MLSLQKYWGLIFFYNKCLGQLQKITINNQ